MIATTDHICNKERANGRFNAALALTANQRDLAMVTPTLFDLPQRIQDKISPEPMSGCWLWTAALTEDGYGSVGTGEGTKTALAHRLVFFLLGGEMPAGTEQDHVCRVRSCVNPAHLEPVTHLMNIRRGARVAPPHCPKGHEYTEQNSKKYNLPSGAISRACRVCARAAKNACMKRRRTSTPPTPKECMACNTRFLTGPTYQRQRGSRFCSDACSDGFYSLHRPKRRFKP
jgi:hypothetical protein